MKTYKNLYPQICTFENLFLAFRAAAKGKRGRPEVAAFEQELEPNLFRLQEELVAQTYQPAPYTHFPIRDPKPRIISAADFRDRVVHHALVRVIEPIFEARFIHDSYACPLPTPAPSSRGNGQTPPVHGGDPPSTVGAGGKNLVHYTHHVSRITHHVSRFTHYASRLTFHTRRSQ